jgi:hypothetical protein
VWIAVGFLVFAVIVVLVVLVTFGNALNMD